MHLFSKIRKRLIPTQSGEVTGEPMFGSAHRAAEPARHPARFAIAGIAMTVAIFVVLPYRDVGAVEVDAEQLLQRAQAGSVSAQLMLGLAYHDGRYGLPRDDHAAAGWLERAAEAGNMFAAVTLGDAYAHGKGVRTDLHMAEHWWRRAALTGNVHAQAQLGLALSNASDQEQRDEGHQWLERAATAGDATARHALDIEAPATEQVDQVLGPHSLLGAVERTVEESFTESVSDLKQRAENGDSEAEYELAMRYRDGSWGVAANPKLALRWLQRAADEGNPVAMDSLATAYEQGQLGLIRDSTAAAAWRKRANAVRNDPDSRQ